MPSSQIDTKLENHIDAYAERAQAEVRGVMERIASDAATVARATLGTSHHGPDSIHRGIHPLPVVHQDTLWETGVTATDWKSNFFEKGTHAHSIRKGGRWRLVSAKTGKGVRKAVGVEGSGFVSGVAAYHYLEHGIRVSSASLRLLISSRFSRIRV